jgi:catechol 2,3-dioxygenase-like lactoylglutathione lyase family enzyme
VKIAMTSIHVDDQEKALRFYTDVLGFQTKHDIPMGEHRWITVVSPQAPDGVELVLEPNGHPAVRPYTEALVADGIPFTAFAVDDVQAEYDRLVAAGVVFTQPPVAMGPVTTAVLDDTCGNLIQLVG